MTCAMGHSCTSTEQHRNSSHGLCNPQSMDGTMAKARKQCCPRVCTGSWYGTRSCPHSLRNNGARCKMQAACASEPWQTEAGQVTQRNHTQAPVGRRAVLRTVHSQRTSGRAAWSTRGHVWKVTCHGSHPHSPNSWRKHLCRALPRIEVATHSRPARTRDLAAARL